MVYIPECKQQLRTINCNMNIFFSFDLFMVYIPECKQQLRTMNCNMNIFFSFDLFMVYITFVVVYSLFSSMLITYRKSPSAYIHCKGCHGRERIVVGFITTYAISAYHHWSCESKSYIVVVSFIGGGNRSTQRKPPIYRKSLTNLIT
jgi:hypothetical protein